MTIGRAQFTADIQGQAEVIGALQALSFAARERVEQAIRHSSRRIARSAKNRAPLRTGRFRRSIRPRYSKDGLSAEIAAWGRRGPHPLAHLIEFGTAPHAIKPKRKKALAFHGGATGQMGPTEANFAKEVQHPGTPARPFLFPAYEENKAEYLRDLKAAMGRAGRDAAAKWGKKAGRARAGRQRSSLRRAGLL